MTDVDKFIKDAAGTFQQRQGKKRYTQLRGRRGAEIEMHTKWVQGGRQDQQLAPLLQSIDPMIERETRKRMGGMGGSVPASAIKGQLRRAAVRAIQTWEPGKGAALHTHITQGFHSVSDFAAKMRNTKHLPRKKLEQYQKVQNAKNDLAQQYGREPSTAEVQRATGLSGQLIKQLERVAGKEAFTGMGTGTLEHDPGLQPEAARSAFLTMKPTMTPEMRRFGDMHFPKSGKRQLSVDQIANHMKIPRHRAYWLKTQVEKKMERILKGA